MLLIPLNPHLKPSFYQAISTIISNQWRKFLIYTFHSCVCICFSFVQAIRTLWIKHMNLWTVWYLSNILFNYRLWFDAVSVYFNAIVFCYADSLWMKHCERIIHFLNKNSRLRMWKRVSTVQVNIVDYREFVCSIFLISFQVVHSQFWCLLCVLTWFCLIVLPLYTVSISIDCSPQPMNLMNNQQKQITFTFHPLKYLKRWMKRKNEWINFKPTIYTSRHEFKT